MVVLKFGGTSVRDEVWMDKTLDITAKELIREPILVASAMTKVTDRLQEIAIYAEQGNIEKAYDSFKWIKDHHFKVASAFITGENLKKCNDLLEDLFSQLNSIIKGLSFLKECSDRSNDMILAFGERLSTIILYYRAKERGINAELVDAREFIKTNSNFKNAALIESLTNTLIIQHIKPAKNKMYITQGFIGSNENGITTTLGRGGSDYTAAIIGAALNATEIQIWTDVDGIMTCDPRIIENVATIPVVSYQEAAELAYFGAKVLHPATIQPATSKGIPVLVKNTGRPEAKGTTIVGKADGYGPKAIAFKKNITVINISSDRMLLAYGFLRRIFEIFEKYKTSVDLIATSEVSVSVTIDNPAYLTQISDELKKIGVVNFEANKSIVSIVGQDLWKDPAIILKIFSHLQDISIRMISMGASDTNFSFVIPVDLTEKTVKALHKGLFG